MHIKKLILLLFLVPVLAQAQKTTGPNYTYIAQRYEWLAGVFKALGLPAGDSAQFQTGQERRAGAIYYDSTGVDSGLYVWSGLVWRSYEPYTDADARAAVKPDIDSVTAIDEFAPDSVSSKLLSEWIPQVTPLDRVWVNFTWSPELRRLVAVSHSGSGQDVMTSDDGGITWIARTTPAQEWRGVAWSSKLKLFAAVGGTGTGNRVMTSPDGITWTNRTSTGDYKWRDIVWSDELEIFVAVANRSSGTGGNDRVMTSTDGITWTSRVTPEEDWSDIVWAKELGLFCVSATGGGAGGFTSAIMTSPDGITWTSRTTPTEGNSWEGLTWSGDKRLFVAVSFGGASGAGKRVMTSPDGITWTLRSTPQDAQWLSVAWSRELNSFAAVCDNLTSQIMTSPDGITWTLQTAPLVKQWRRIYWVKELGSFIAVAYTFSTSGVGNLIMRSRPLDLTGQYLNKFGKVDQTVQGDVTFNDSLINKKVLSAIKLDVGVSTTTPSAIIDASSTTKGVIWPRMTTAQKNAIASPATGLIVFDTDLVQYNFWDGDSWEAMGGGAAPTAFNDIGDATGAGLVTVGNNSQQWDFTGLTGSGLLIQSNTTAATNNLHKVLRVVTTGTNAGTPVTSFGSEIINSHTGTASTNIGLSVAATSGTNNHALVVGAGNGNVGFGTATPNSTAILELSDTARGFLPSRMTAAQRTAIGSPASALFLWDNDSTRYMGYNGSAWRGIAWTGEGGAGGGTWGSITGTLSDQTDLQAALDAKANTALSNLASVAINTSLISDANNTDDLGSTSLAWKDIYSYTSKLKGSTSGEITLQATATAGTNTITFPAATGTVPLTNQTNSWSLLNTFSGGIVANTFQTSVTSTNSNLLVGNAVGGTASTLSEYLFGTAAAVGMRVGIRGSSALTTAANASYANLLIGDNVFQEAGSGTHWGMGDLVIAGSTVTNGAGSTDYLFGAYIEGPPTGITPNVASYGLWIDNGTSRFDGDISLNTVGSKINIATGSDASIGVSAAMTAGAITISTTAVTASSIIILTHATLGGTQGILSVGTITAGTSFVINSSNAADTGTVNWWIVN